MKIGIITLHNAISYGANLQAYALQQCLRKLGHDPYFINYQRRLIYSSRFERNLYLKFIKSNVFTPLVNANRLLLKNVFYDFQRRNLNIGPDKYINTTELESSPPLADAYICGSDQIWNTLVVHEDDRKAFFLCFGNKNTKRIAYAASFGSEKVESNFKKQLSVYAKDFVAIGLREKSGLDILRSIGCFDSVMVPDPTLLLDAEDYHAIISNKVFRKPYCFSYFLLSFMASLINSSNAQLERKLKMKVQSVLSLENKDCKPYFLLRNIFKINRLGPGEWLNRIRNSNFVITNSYHGLIFSLIFNKPFIIQLKTDTFAGLNNRITSLLDVVGLQHRAIATYDPERIEALCREEIEWKTINKRLMEYRNVGYNFLQTTLSKLSPPLQSIF